MNTHEQFCIDTATHFTAVRGSKPANRIKQEFATMQQAIDFAAQFGDKRTMVYAVNALGNSAHICNA